MLYETRLAYYDDPYQTTLETEILRVDEEDGETIVYLDTTIFYPYGGGQPADQGTIVTASGKANVRNVLLRDGIVRHLCKLTEGNIEERQIATLTLDWERRYRNMRVHSAGHIIHDVLLEMVEGLTPVRGDHGSKPYIEYRVARPIDLSAETLESKVNQVIKQGRSVVTRETTLDELSQLTRFLPPNLPKDKPLRMMQIEGYYAMPDGGTQVRDIAEVGPVEITSLSSGEDKARIKYRVHDLT